MKKILLFFLLLFSAIFTTMGAGHVVSITTTNNATCYGSCNGSMTASVSGGVGPFTFAWSPSGGSSATASSLCAGIYTVTVTDNSDLSTATATATVTQPPVLNATITGGTPVCGGGCTTLNANATGGTPVYTYNWAPTGPLTWTYFVCPSSTTSYTVTVVDVNGCVTSTNTAVPVMPSSTVTVPSSTSVCRDATVAAGIFSSTPAGATYVWTNSNTSIGLAANGTGNVPSFVATNPGASPISATITVTPTYGGCPGTPNSYTITVKPLPVITVPPSNSACSGGCVTLNASSSGAGSTFLWSPSTYLATVGISNPVCCPLTSINYTITVTDTGGCSANAVTTVLLNGPASSGISATNTTGCAVCDGTISMSPIGGTGPYLYSWPGGASGMGTTTGYCAGTYSVTTMDASGCTLTDSVTVFSTNDVAANFTFVPDSTNAYNFFCFNSSTGPGLTYLWDFADGVVASAASPSHTYALAGTYNVCLYASSALCGDDTLCQNITVTGVLSSCLALFNIADDTTTSDPNALYVYNLSYGATLGYLWDFGDGTTSTLATPSHIYSGPGPFNLCLTVDNGSGCSQTYCDILTNVDSLNRSGTLSIQVIDVPPFQPLITQLNDISNATHVDVFPNPFHESTTFVITSKENAVYSFEMTDVLGKKVKTLEGITEKQFQISREGLQNGMYFYKIYTAETLFGTGKILVK
ncbi:MAG TPA: PKD domain-containing protein [Bacteroidia bacterium]|jgi:PKD repeat protein